MKERYTVALRQSVPVLAVAAALGVLGSAALPVIFTGQPGVTGIWLVAAILIAVCVLALMPALARPLAASLSSLTALVASPNVPGQMIAPRQTLILARLLVFIAEVLITQAVLRKPIAVVLGGERQSAPVEAAIATAALTILLALLMWTYQTARPIVQAGVLRALDAAIPTLGSVSSVERPTTGSQAASPPTVRAPVMAHTVATGDKTLAVGDATVASPHRLAQQAQAADETVVSPRHADDPLKGGR